MNQEQLVNQIQESINEVFVNYTESIETDTISYLVGVVCESTSEAELEEQVKSVVEDFQIESEIKLVKDLVSRLISVLRKRGCLDFESRAATKSYLVCELDPNAEPSLDDPNLTMDQYLELTRSSNSNTRRLVLRKMCPCKVKKDVDLLWTRIMEMSTDQDPKVRYQVLHNLCDGSPLWREEAVISTLQSMHNDKDPKIRRRVHNILTHYSRYGKWNIM